MVFSLKGYDHRRFNANSRSGPESTIPLSIHNDNRQYPEAAIPFNGQPRAVPKPKISFGSVTIQKDNTYTATPDSSNYYGSITKIDRMPGTSSSHTPTSSDSKIGRVSGTTIDEDTRAILTQNHNEVMSAIAFLKNELELVKQHLSTLITSDIEIKRDLQRALSISN